MLKFITYSILLIVVVSISSYGIFNAYALEKSYIVNKMTNLDDKYGIINLGSSHGWSFDYTATHLKGAQINRAGNSPYYDWQHYNYLVERDQLEDSSIVIILASFFTFGVDENRTDDGKDAPFVNDFYYYLPRKKIFNYEKSRESRLIIERIQKNFWTGLEENSKKGSKQKKEIPSTPKPKAQVKPIEKNKVNTDSLEKIELKKIEFRLNKLAKTKGKHHLKLGAYSDHDKNIEYFSKLIQEIQVNGHQAVLVTTPFPNAYLNLFEKAWLEEHFYQQIQKLLSKHSIPYLDYSKKESICGNPRYFKDADHLNDKGKKVFSKMFFNDLVKINILDKEKLNADY